MRTVKFLKVLIIALSAMKEITVKNFFNGIIMDNVSVRKVIMIIIKIVFVKNAQIFGTILLKLK